MTFTLVPTYTNQRWGPDSWCKFDYYQHPTRDGGSGNPLILFRHGGGGSGGQYSNSNSTDTLGDLWYLLYYLNGGYTSSPAQHWDLCLFTSGQMKYTKYGGTVQDYSPIPATSRALVFPDNVRDCQRAIASIKSMHLDYGFNPNQVTGFGSSFGAWVMGLSQMAPPLRTIGGGPCWTEGAHKPLTQDSRLKGVVLDQPQVDCRQTAGVDYLRYDNMAYWIGTTAIQLEDADNITWTQVGRRLIIGAANGKFANMVAGDTFTLTGGTNVIVGKYTVEAVIDKNTIKLTTSCSATAGNLATGDITGWLDFQTNRLPSAVRNAMSIRAYFDLNDTTFYPGFFISGAEQGDHIKPYSNPHDSLQHSELSSSIAAKGLSYGTYTFTPGDLTNASHPSAPNSTVLARYRNWSDWLATQIGAA